MPRKTILPKRLIRRIETSLFIIILIFFALSMRLLYIMTVNNELYTQRLENQNNEVVELNSGRGTIYDINGVALTDTESENIIIIDKLEYLKNEEIKNTLLELAQSDKNYENEIMTQVKTQLESKSSVIMEIEASYIDSKNKELLLQHGASIDKRYERYSDENLLTHTIGYIRQSDNEGVLGIESEYNDLLKDSNKDYISVFKAGQSGNLNNENISSLKGTMEIVKKK